MIPATGGEASCTINIYAVTDTKSEDITWASDYSDQEATGFSTVLGQWGSFSTEIELLFSVTCNDGPGTLQIAAVSFMGPEMVCTSQCAAPTTTLFGDLIQDGDFTDEDYGGWLTNYDLVTADDNAPGGGQCIVISKDESEWYHLNQTISDAQVGRKYHASLSWRVKSTEVIGDVVVQPSCSISYYIYNVTESVLLSIAFDQYTLTSSDSGWMSLNGTWDATISDGKIMIYFTCLGDYDYYPEVEIADVKLALKTVRCISPSSSAVLASSKPLKSSSIAVSTPVSTPLVRSTALSSSTPVIRSTSIVRSTPVSTPLVRSTPLSSSTPVSQSVSSSTSSTPVSKIRTIPAVVPKSTPLSSLVASVSPIRSTRLVSASLSALAPGSSSASISSSVAPVSMDQSTRLTSPSPPVQASVPLSFTRSPIPISSSISISATLSPSHSTSSQVTDSVSSSSTFAKPSSVAPESSKSPASVPNPGPTSVIASSVVLSSKTRNSSGSLETASSSPEALPSFKSTSTLPQTVPTTQAKPQLTTSTIFTTSTRTAIACPSTITNCLVTAKTTYVTTETIVVSTTICPVAEAEETHQTTAVQTGNSDYTSTVLTTREITITSCAGTVTDCPARSQTTFISTQTLVAGTTVIPARETASNNSPSETGVATTNPTTGLADTEITASEGSGEVNPITATTASSGESTSTLESSNLPAGSSGIKISTSFTGGAIPTSAGEEENYQTTATASNMAAESGASSIAPALTISDESPTLNYAEGSSSSETLSTAAALNVSDIGSSTVESKKNIGPGVNSAGAKVSTAYSKPISATPTGAHFTLVTPISSSTSQSTGTSPAVSVYTGATSTQSVQFGLLGLIMLTLGALML